MLSSALKFDSVMKRVFGSSNDRRLKGYRPKVAEINALVWILTVLFILRYVYLAAA